jgi:phosphoglycerate kinase
MIKHKLPKITDCEDLKDKKVLVRGDFDVPVNDEGEVVDQFRLVRGVSTIRFLVDQGAKVILMGHIGRDPENSLLPVFNVLKDKFNIKFTGDVGGADSKNAVDEMQSGEVIMLENLRRDPRETKNDPEFVKQLADLGEVYVDAAFSVAHREHASMFGVPKLLPAYASINFAHEVEELSKALRPESPSLFILGGAKFDTKMPLVERYLKIYNHVFVGGALANDFFKGLGFEVGKSLVSDIDLSGHDILNHPKILLPIDVTVKNDDGIRVVKPEQVTKEDNILDAGPETIAMLKEHVDKAQMILWNGPLGDYEHGFGTQTLACAQLIAEAGGYSVVGGGDTVAAIEELNNQDQYGFLSTAGGAMLEFLEHGTLPAIEVLKK